MKSLKIRLASQKSAYEVSKLCASGTTVVVKEVDVRSSIQDSLSGESKLVG